MRIGKVCEMLFQVNGDERGKLTVIEGMKDIPFDIKRIFYIYGSDSDVVRGCHANRKSEFILVNVCGSSKIKVSDGDSEKLFTLDKPNKGIYLPCMIWKEMYDFSPNSVLLCLASEAYIPEEYIREYADFAKENKDVE